MRVAVCVLVVWMVSACDARTGGDEPPADAGGSGGGGAGGGGGSGGAPLQSFPLPASLDLGGDASSIAAGDVDGDGFRDVAALVKRSGEQRASLVVAFGDAGGSFSQRFEHDLSGPVARTSREASSRVVAIGDLDGDGSLDVACASGVALGGAGRALGWQGFSDEARHAFQPAALVQLGKTFLVRGGADGWIERCSASGACEPLPGQQPPCGPGEGCALEELVVADFDGDSRPDLLGGGPPWSSPEERALLWESTTLWQAPLAISGLSTADLEAGDIDQDGVADVVAQRRAPAPDAPADTDVWLGAPGGVTPLVRVQTIGNHDAPSDVHALADASFDGCLDLVHVGAVSGQIALRLGTATEEGCGEYLGPHDASQPSDAGWITAPGVLGSVGVQQLEVNGDGIPEWVIRAPAAMSDPAEPFAALLYFVAVPPL